MERELAQENMHSTKKASTKKRTRSGKNDNGQESKQETTLSVKKIRKKDSSCFNWSDRQIITKLLKVKLLEISPNLNISFFLGRERIFFTLIVFS